MRRAPIGGGWILLAAAAVPFVVEAAKPLAKAVGKGLKRLGEMIDEAASEVAEEETATTAPKPEEEIKEEEPVKVSKSAATTKKAAPNKVTKPVAKKSIPKTATKKQIIKEPTRHEPPKPSVVQSASMMSQETTGRRRPPSDVQTG